MKPYVYVLLLVWHLTIVLVVVFWGKCTALKARGYISRLTCPNLWPPELCWQFSCDCSLSQKRETVTQVQRVQVATLCQNTSILKSRRIQIWNLCWLKYELCFRRWLNSIHERMPSITFLLRMGTDSGGGRRQTHHEANWWKRAFRGQWFSVAVQGCYYLDVI